VIAYASRGLTPAESRYSAHKLEFLAVKWAVTDKFRDHLYGCTFTIYTDNNPLCYVMSTAKLDACRQRWVAEFSAFQFEIIYRPGKRNAAISPKQAVDVVQAHQHCTAKAEGLTLKETDMVESQRKDSHVSKVIDCVKNGKKPSGKERKELSGDAKLMLKSSGNDYRWRVDCWSAK